MIEDYLHMDLKNLGYFSGLVILVAVLITMLYWFIFGFNTWKNNVQTASDLMLAAAPAGSPTGGRAGGQAGNGGFNQAAATLPMGQTPHNTHQNSPGTNNPVSGQFICPTHGAVGLPVYNGAGDPVCPLGDQIMQFKSAGSNNFAAAAAAGG